MENGCLLKVLVDLFSPLAGECPAVTQEELMGCFLPSLRQKASPCLPTRNLSCVSYFSLGSIVPSFNTLQLSPP